MEVIYELPVESEIELPVRTGTPPIEINGATVSWEVNEESTLDTIVLRIPHQPLKFDERGVILSTYPELESLAYRLTAYIANSVFKQTGFDAINRETVVGLTPVLRGETAEEKRQLASCPRTAGAARSIRYDIRGNFEPEAYPRLYEHSPAVALIADALRVRSPFQQYELFYKVIEWFFPKKKGQAFHKAVSAHAYPIDSRFCESCIKALYDLRNRITHPHAHHGHVNPEDVQAVREVKNHILLVRDLAMLLFEYPPA
jgi:hypothetical protein